jgi:hypothetical protein
MNGQNMLEYEYILYENVFIARYDPEITIIRYAQRQKMAKRNNLKLIGH